MVRKVWQCCTRVWFSEKSCRLFCICQEEKGGDGGSSGYVDDIVLTGDDVEAIKKLKAHTLL